MTCQCPACRTGGNFEALDFEFAQEEDEAAADARQLPPVQAGLSDAARQAGFEPAGGRWVRRGDRIVLLDL